MSSPSSSTTTPPTVVAGATVPMAPLLNIGDLVWGAVRGHPAWPGKIINLPSAVDSSGDCIMGGNGQTTVPTTPTDCVWVRWFGGRPNAELVSVNGLKTLSEGLDAHHKAQKDARK